MGTCKSLSCAVWPLHHSRLVRFFFSNTTDEKSLFTNWQLLVTQSLDIIAAGRYYASPDTDCDYSTVPITGINQCQGDFLEAIGMFYASTFFLLKSWTCTAERYSIITIGQLSQRYCQKRIFRSIDGSGPVDRKMDGAAPAHSR